MDKFQYLAVVTKAFVEKSEVEGKEVSHRFMEVTLSGVKEDRDGDRMSEKAISNMVDQLNSGKVPFYLNHGLDANGDRSYRVEDMAGVWKRGRVEGDNLIGTVLLNNANPSADTIWNYHQAGMPLGFSVGGRVIEKRVEEVEL